MRKPEGNAEVYRQILVEAKRSCVTRDDNKLFMGQSENNNKRQPRGSEKATTGSEWSRLDLFKRLFVSVSRYGWEELEELLNECHTSVRSFPPLYSVPFVVVLWKSVDELRKSNGKKNHNRSTTQPRIYKQHCGRPNRTTC